MKPLKKMKKRQPGNEPGKNMAALLACLFAMWLLFLLPGCSGTTETASPSDLSGTEPSASEEELLPVPVDRVLEVRIGEETDEEVFLLQYKWDGEEYATEDSFQKMMMIRYMPEGQHAPTANDEDVISFVFSKGVETPVEVKLMQLGNTVRSNTGIPYDTLEPELLFDGSQTYSFSVSFRDFKMYYYYLDCTWENGNEIHYGFAIEKAGSFKK